MLYAQGPGHSARVLVYPDGHGPRRAGSRLRGLRLRALCPPESRLCYCVSQCYASRVKAEGQRSPHVFSPGQFLEPKIWGGTYVSVGDIHHKHDITTTYLYRSPHHRLLRPRHHQRRLANRGNG